MASRPFAWIVTDFEGEDDAVEWTAERLRTCELFRVNFRHRYNPRLGRNVVLTQPGRKIEELYFQCYTGDYEDTYQSDSLFDFGLTHEQQVAYLVRQGCTRLDLRVVYDDKAVRNITLIDLERQPRHDAVKSAAKRPPPSCGVNKEK